MMAETIDKRSAVHRQSSDGRTPAPLRMSYLQEEAAPLHGSPEPLLEVRFEPAPASRKYGPGLVLPLAVIGASGGGSPVERWEVPGPVRRTEEPPYTLVEGDTWFAGWAQARGDDIEGDARSLYCQLLTLAAERGWHLHRIWNVVPRINQEERADVGTGEVRLLERYRLFCRGRAEAFDQCWGPEFESRLCAFTAVGSDSGPFVLHFLASRVPGNPVENPRQIPAWNYPDRYGPRSPSFARGLRLADECGGDLLLSGTASIVGHESQHEGDVVAQTQETIRNLQELAGEQQRLSAVKIYLRHAEDRERVEPLVAGVLAEVEDILWLRADLCRSELAIEIEGMRKG